MRKTFTEQDRDQFLDDGFEFMARFFENSLTELKARNPSLETAFKRIDATRFAATAYKNGTAKARCLIQLGGQFGGISLSYGENYNSNSINESMSVTIGELSLTIHPLGMQSSGSSTHKPHLATRAQRNIIGIYSWSHCSTNPHSNFVQFPKTAKILGDISTASSAASMAIQGKSPDAISNSLQLTAAVQQESV